MDQIASYVISFELLYFFSKNVPLFLFYSSFFDFMMDCINYLSLVLLQVIVIVQFQLTLANYTENRRTYM